MSSTGGGGEGHASHVLRVAVGVFAAMVGAAGGGTLLYQIGYDNGSAAPAGPAQTVTETETVGGERRAAGSPADPRPNGSERDELVYDPAGSVYRGRELRMPRSGQWDLDGWTADAVESEVDLFLSADIFFPYSQVVEIEPEDAADGVEFCRQTTGYGSYPETDGVVQRDEGKYLCVRTSAGALAILYVAEARSDGEVVLTVTLWPG